MLINYNLGHNKPAEFQERQKTVRCHADFYPESSHSLSHPVKTNMHVTGNLLMVCTLQFLIFLRLVLKKASYLLN